MTTNTWDKTGQADQTVLTPDIGRHWREVLLKELSQASHSISFKAHACKHFKHKSELLIEERIHMIKS